MGYHRSFKMDELDLHKMTQRDFHKVLLPTTKPDSEKYVEGDTIFIKEVYKYILTMDKNFELPLYIRLSWHV